MLLEFELDLLTKWLAEYGFITSMFLRVLQDHACFIYNASSKYFVHFHDFDLIQFQSTMRQINYNVYMFFLMLQMELFTHRVMFCRAACINTELDPYCQYARTIITTISEYHWLFLTDCGIADGWFHFLIYQYAAKGPLEKDISMFGIFGIRNVYGPTQTLVISVTGKVIFWWLG